MKAFCRNRLVSSRLKEKIQFPAKAPLGTPIRVEHTAGIKGIKFFRICPPRIVDWEPSAFSCGTLMPSHAYIMAC